MNRLLLLLFIITTVWFASCEREDISSNPALKLKFSTDTVMFDTVFTTIGSSTQYFKVYNRNKHDLKISSIQLVGGNSSFYRMNVDGIAANNVEDVTIRSNDSLFVFVEVTIDPSNQNSPLLAADSIIFITNGNVQDVKLIAWGQDVNLFNKKTLDADSVLTPDKPYLINGYLYVKPNVELKILAGTKLYFHNNSYLLVKGSLKVDGTSENPVIFEGDRREIYYRDKAGQWGGIWLLDSCKYNEIKWAEIRNAINGVIVDTFYTVDAPTLKISNSIVENMSSIALYARGSKINADNCLFSNSGDVCVALTIGGNYNFYQCTIANYWGQYIYRKGPALLLNNYYLYQQNGSYAVIARDLENASFNNCIIYGSREQEFEIDNVYDGQIVSAEMNYNFDHCILKVPSNYSVSNPDHFISVIKDNPKFKDPSKLNFQLDTLSPAKDFGLIDYANLYPIDLKNYSHLLDSGPDLGAYERKE